MAIPPSSLALGIIRHYDVLYIVMPQLATAAAAGLTAWVKAGGTVVAAPGAGLQNEANATNKV
jgi:hypothetical protein